MSAPTARRRTIDVPAHRPRAGRSAGARSWTDQAACRAEDPELFWPVTSDPLSPRVAEARAVCHRCPVLADCQQWAMANMPDDDGIAAGMTGPERRALRDGG